MDLKWSSILIMCRSLLDDVLLQLSYFCGGILSNVMLEWSDDREHLSHSKQYMLQRLVGIHLAVLHWGRVSSEQLGFEYPSITNLSLSWHFFMVFFLIYKARLSKFYIDSYFENKKILCQSHVHVYLNVISRKVRKFCTFCLFWGGARMEQLKKN